MKHIGIFPHLLMVSSKLVIVGSQLLKAVWEYLMQETMAHQIIPVVPVHYFGFQNFSLTNLALQQNRKGQKMRNAPWNGIGVALKFRINGGKLRV